MKKREDMIRNVHRRIEEYNAEKKRKNNRMIRSAVYVVSAACILGCVFLGIKHSSLDRNREHGISVIDTVENSEVPVHSEQTTVRDDKPVTSDTGTTALHNERITESITYTTIDDTTVTTSGTENSEDDNDENNDQGEDNTDNSPDDRTEPAPAEHIRTTAAVPKVTETTVVNTPDSHAVPSSANSEHDGFNTVPGAAPQADPGSSINFDSFPWDELPVEKRYTEAVLNELNYRSAEKETEAPLLVSTP